MLPGCILYAAYRTETKNTNRISKINIIGVLRSKIQELTDKNSNLTSQQSEIDETIEKLTTKISSLKRQKDQLQISINKNDEELDDLKKEFDSFERKFTNLSINHSPSSGAGTAEGNICKKCVLPLEGETSCETPCEYQHFSETFHGVALAACVCLQLKLVLSWLHVAKAWRKRIGQMLRLLNAEASSLVR